MLSALLLAAAVAAAPERAPAAPARVASLNLAADEVLVEILPPARLVAVTRLIDEQGTSNAVGRVPAAVPRFARADVERLIALAPDLVIVSEYTDPDLLRLLEQAGLRVYHMSGLASHAGMRQAILDLGDAVGARPGADRLVARFDATLSGLRRRLQGAPRPRVLYWANPTRPARAPPSAPSSSAAAAPTWAPRWG
jgi:iron complex transport system substrate-binding protein